MGLLSKSTRTIRTPMNAQPGARGRVIGVYNMSALGLRAFAGITVGLGGSALGIHVSLLASVFALLVILGGLGWWARAGRPG